MKVSVVIPLYNEESLISNIVQRFGSVFHSQKASVDYEMIFVNDGSRDHTLAYLQQEATRHRFSCKVVSFRRNFGHYNAIYAGLENASGDYIVLIDGDLQDPPELIPKLVKTIVRERHDIVYARRILRQDGIIKKFLSNIFYKVFNKFSSVRIPENTGIFRCITAEVKRIVLEFPENDKFLLGLMEYPGFKVGFVEYERDERKSGDSKYPFGKSLRLAWQGLTSFTTFPLTLIKTSGYIVSLFTLMFIIYIVFRKIVYNTAVSGWSSIVILISGLFGLNFIFLGTFGEYIAKIIQEVKKRPNYYIKEVLEIAGEDV